MGRKPEGHSTNNLLLQMQMMIIEEKKFGGSGFEKSKPGPCRLLLVARRTKAVALTWIASLNCLSESMMAFVLSRFRRLLDSGIDVEATLKLMELERGLCQQGLRDAER